jgi:hypothetical protein
MSEREPGYTPGPWEADTTKERGHITYQIAARDGDTSVANIDGYQGCVRGTLIRLPAEENAANARLILAAPEMLGALNGIVAHVKEQAASAMAGPWWRAQSERIRAAIAKAEGR